MAYSEKVIDHYENPRNVGQLRQGRSRRRHGPRRRARLRRRDEAAAQDQRRRRSSRTRSSRPSAAARPSRRRRSRPSGSRARRSTRPMDDQEHADRRGADAAAGEDPLLGAGRGRHQGRHRRLQGQASWPSAGAASRPSSRRGRQRAAVRRLTSWLSESATRRSPRSRRRPAARETPPKGLRVGVRGGGCTGFSYLFEWADTEPRPEDKVLSFEDGAVRVFVDPKSYCSSTARRSTSRRR